MPCSRKTCEAQCCHFATIFMPLLATVKLQILYSQCVSVVMFIMLLPHCQ
jgi:hypothetical protein